MACRTDETRTVFTFTQEEIVQGAADMLAEAGAVVLAFTMRGEEYDNGTFPHLTITLSVLPNKSVLSFVSNDDPEAAEDDYEMVVGEDNPDEFAEIMEWLLGDNIVRGEHVGVNFSQYWPNHFDFELVVRLAPKSVGLEVPIRSKVSSQYNVAWVRPDGTPVLRGRFAKRSAPT